MQGELKIYASKFPQVSVHHKILKYVNLRRINRFQKAVFLRHSVDHKLVTEKPQKIYIIKTDEYFPHESPSPKSRWSRNGNHSL